MLLFVLHTALHEAAGYLGHLDNIWYAQTSNICPKVLNHWISTTDYLIFKCNSSSPWLSWEPTSCSVRLSLKSRVLTAVQSCCISLSGRASSPGSKDSSSFPTPIAKPQSVGSRLVRWLGSLEEEQSLIWCCYELVWNVIIDPSTLLTLCPTGNQHNPILAFVN